MNSFWSARAQASQNPSFGRSMSEPLTKRRSDKNEINTCLWWFSTFRDSFTPESPGVKTLGLITWYKKMQVQFRVCCQCLLVEQPAIVLLGWREREDPSIHLFVLICLLRGSLPSFVWGILCFLPSNNLYHKGRNTKPPFMTVMTEALDSKATSGWLIE